MTLPVKVKFARDWLYFNKIRHFSKLFKSTLYTYSGPVINYTFLLSSLLNVSSLSETILIIPRLLII